MPKPLTDSQGNILPEKNHISYLDLYKLQANSELQGKPHPTCPRFLREQIGINQGCNTILPTLQNLLLTLTICSYHWEKSSRLFTVSPQQIRDIFFSFHSDSFSYYPALSSPVILPFLRLLCLRHIQKEWLPNRRQV